MSLLQMSLSAGLLIIVIVIMRAVALNKLPKTAFLILWGIVLIRLLVPISIPMQFSIHSVVMGLAETVWSNSTSAYSETPPIAANIPVFSENSQINTPPEILPHVSEIPQQARVPNMSSLTVVWLVGMLGLFIFFAVAYFKQHRILRFAAHIRNDSLSDWLKQHRLWRQIAILQSDRITTPFTVGIIRPRIILPKNMDMHDTQLLHHVLLHEYFHIKRFDAFWKILMVLALCIHWFNPLVWVMFVRANRDLELTCDELVLRYLGAETKTAYAYSIISMAEQRSKFASLYNGFSKDAVEERIISIMKIKKSSVAGIILSIILICVLTFGAIATFAGNTDMEYYNTDQVFDLNMENYDVQEIRVDDEENSIITVAPDLPMQDPFSAINGAMVIDIESTVEQAHVAEPGYFNAQNEEIVTPQSPFIIARTLEEVRAIIALEDGSIPITDVDVPEIRSRQADGIIITEQCLYEALDVLNYAYAQDGHPIRNLTTPWVEMSPTFDEMDDFMRILIYRSHLLSIASRYLEIDVNGFSQEEHDRVREKAEQLLDLYDGEWPSDESTRGAVQRLFGTIDSY